MNFPLYQNDPRLHVRPSIEPYGCLFRSLGEIAEAHVGEALTPRELIDMYDWLIEQGYMLDEKGHQSWVQDHAAVINAGLYYLGAEQTAEYAWRMDLAGQGKGFGSPAGCNYFIAQARMDGWSISHFYRSDSRGDRMRDPYWPPKETIKVISIRGYEV